MNVNMKSKLYIIFSVIILLILIPGCSGKGSRVENIPIFLYHSVKPSLEKGDSESMVVTTENFEMDLKYLRDNGYTSIDLATLIDAYNDPKVKLPKKPFVITFDDGYSNNYEYAYPLLKEYNTKAVIHTIVWSVGRDRFILNDDPITPHFTWEEGKEMVASGLIELGSHTFDMHSPAGISYGYEQECGFGLEPIKGENDEEYYQRIYRDIEKSKALMEENMGIVVSSFAYPYGKYNDIVIDVLKDLDFKIAFILDSNEANASIFEVKRINIGNDLRLSEILTKD